MLSQRRLATEWLMLLIGGVFLAALAAQAQLTRRLDLVLLNAATALAVQPPARDVAIVAIDERSLARIGEWPWRRSTHAQLIDRLRESGARVVLYDVLLVDPGDPADDAQLAAAIARHGKIVLPFGFLAAPNRADGLEPEYPLPEFARAAAALGHTELMPDDDGTLRRFALTRTVGERAFPHFVPQALAIEGKGAISAAVRPGEPWPVIPFNRAGSYPFIPAFAVIDGSVPSALIEGRTILVGATAQGMGDTHAVSSGTVGLMSGVEMQANLLDALRAGTPIRELPPIWSAALAALALLVQFLGFRLLPARAGLLLSAGLIVAIPVVTIALVPMARVWIAPGAALLVVGLAYPLWSWRRLSVLSGYLQREVERLTAVTGDSTLSGGFDVVARQVNRLRHLVGGVSDALTFVRSTIEALPDAMIVLGDGLEVILANRAALALFDETPEPVGQTLPDLYLNQHLAVKAETNTIVLRDGRTFLFATAPLAGRLADSSASCIIAFRDITEIRRRQRENDELIEFLSHDMRSPQVAIMALTAELDVTQADLARRIRSHAQLTLGLADSFVELARVRETGAKFEAHDLAALLHEAIDQAHAAAAGKRINLRRFIIHDPFFAAIDAGQIFRMAANLIGNAVKFTPEDGEVCVTLDLLDDAAQIIVADNGPGLPADRWRDPFARFGTRSHGDGPSAGLGLALVKHVVDAHHGQIEARPASGGGTIFEVRLPLEQDAG